MRAQAAAEAKAAAQVQVEEQVKKMLDSEKEAYMEKLTDSIMKERMKTEDQRLMVQLYVSTKTCCTSCKRDRISLGNVEFFPPLNVFSFLALLSSFSGWRRR